MSDLRGRHWLLASWLLIAFMLVVLFQPLHAQGTLSIVNPTSPAPAYAPGSVVTLNVTKANLATATGFQFDIAAALGATFTVSGGPALPSSKLFQCSPTGPITCVAVGFNFDVIPDGVVAIVVVTLPAALAVPSVNVSIANPVVTDKDGLGLQAALGNPTVSLLIKGGCDVNGDGSVSSADFFAVVNALLGHTTAPALDLNKDSKTNVLDAQIVGTAGTAPAFVCNAR